MTEAYNIVQVSSIKKEQFRIYPDIKYTGFKTNSIKKKKNLSINRYRSNIRAKRRIQELIDINFSNNFCFMTLTFKENMMSIEIANRTFSNFTKRLKRYLNKTYSKQYIYKYICVLETQKRGALHFHIVCNLPFGIKFNDIIQIWNNTIINNKDINIKGGSVHIKFSTESNPNTEKISVYLGKYLLKKDINPIFLGKKIYFTSKNLKKPVRQNHLHYFTPNLEKEQIINIIEKSFKFDLTNKKLISQNYYYDKYTKNKILFLEYKK